MVGRWHAFDVRSLHWPFANRSHPARILWLFDFAADRAGRKAYRRTECGHRDLLDGGDSCRDRFWRLPAQRPRPASARECSPDHCLGEVEALAFIVAGAYAAITSLEGQFITPSLLGKSMRLSSVIVFLSVVVWGWMWGIMGVFLAVPMLITLKIITEKLDAMTPISTILSGSTPIPNEQQAAPE